MYTLSPKEEMLSHAIVDCAYKVHRQLGPGLLEKIYECCFCHELAKRNIPYQRQVKLPVVYDGMQFDEGLVCDVKVDNLIICEMKAVATVHPLWQAQLLSHLRLCRLHVGFVINFNSILIKDGVRRYCSK